MTREQFIQEIAKYVQKYAPQHEIKVYSPIIAQAVLESAAGTSELAIKANNFFGLKYKVGRCPSASGIYVKTGSEQNADGTYTSSIVQWCKFNSLEMCVKGYFEFISHSRYSNLKGITDPKKYLELIKDDGYATSNNYVDNVYRIIQTDNLTRFDVKEENQNMGYTNSSLVNYIKLSPNKTSPRNHVIDTITIHCFVGQVTAESGCNAKNFVTYNPINGSSCNYVVGYDGSIGLCVEEKNRSWCSGNKANDHRAITIEVASETISPYKVTDKALESLINLIADICKRNNIKELKWQANKALIGQVDKQNMTVHRWFASKSCPGDYLYNKHSYIADEVNKRLGVVNPSASTTTRSYLMKGDKGNDVKVLQENLNYLGYSVGSADGIFGAKTDTALRAFQKDYKLTVDGKYGDASKTKLEKAIADKKKASTISATPIVSVSGSNYIYNGINYSLVFNPTYYSNKYSDLKKSFGTNATNLFKHFVQYGMSEKRQASANFDVVTYKNRYPDLQKVFGNNMKEYYKHYIEFGYKEGRSAI